MIQRRCVSQLNGHMTHGGKLHELVHERSEMLWMWLSDIDLVLPIFWQDAWNSLTLRSCIRSLSLFGLLSVCNENQLLLMSDRKDSSVLVEADYLFFIKFVSDYCGLGDGIHPYHLLDSFFMLKAMLLIEVRNGRSFDVSIIPGATWRWQYCWLSCAV